MPQPFEPLRETLLRAGVAPVHVRRYLRELSEHFADLVEDEQAAGRGPDAARAAARARLGGDEALADAMLSQPALRSWTGRAPWATLVVGPILLLVLGWILACLGVALLLAWLPHQRGLFHPPSWLSPVALTNIAAALLDLAEVGGPLLIVSWIARLGAEQRSSLIWPLLGCVAVALFGASLLWDARWPAVGSPEFMLSIGLRGLQHRDRTAAFSLAAWSPSFAIASGYLAVAGAVYGIARFRTRAAAWPQSEC